MGVRVRFVNDVLVAGEGEGKADRHVGEVAQCHRLNEEQMLRIIDTQVAIAAGRGVRRSDGTDHTIVCTGNGVDDPSIEREEVPLVKDSGRRDEPGQRLVHDVDS